MEKSRTQPLKAQCPESDHHVESVIKKHFSQGQNNALKRASGEQWSFHHLHLSFPPRDIAHLPKAMVEEQRKMGKPVVAGTKIPASASLSPLPP